MQGTKVICPYCASSDVVKTGELTTLAVYFCLSCGRTFERRLPPRPAGV